MYHLSIHLPCSTLCCLVYHSHHHHACGAHDAYAPSLIMVSCVRNHSREAAAAPSRPWMATSRRHPLFPFFRTSHPPNYTDATQHAATPGGPRSRYSGPSESRSANGQTPGTGTLRMGFAQLTTSRSRLARARHHRRQSSVTSEFCDLRCHRIPVPRSNAERRSLARVPEPTPRGQLRPITPRFAESATRLSSHHDVHITSPHHYILHRTHRLSRRVWCHKALENARL